MLSFTQKNKLGVDIGTASIKIVELSKEGSRFKLENYGLFELESIEEASGQTSGAQTLQLREDDLAWAIKETLKRSKITAQDTVASIPSFSTFSTVIAVPYLSEQDIAKMIPYEARKYIPIPLNEVYMDWSIVSVAPSNQNQAIPDRKKGDKAPVVEVFIAAVPREEADRYQSVMKKAGLNLKALELENSALIRALVGNDQSPIAIINIGGRSTSIVIVEKGFERVSHNYEVGGFEITKSISRSLNVSIKRAEELKRTLGLKNVNSDTITTAMSSLVDLIVFEAKKIIHTYENVKKSKIASALLIGGLANMPMFMEYFGSKLELPVSPGNPLARILYPPKLEGIKSEINSTFTVALGLGMKEI